MRATARKRSLVVLKTRFNVHSFAEIKSRAGYTPRNRRRDLRMKVINSGIKQ